MAGEDGGQDSRAELFESISHPARIKILQVLNEKSMGFAELKRSVGIESSGNLSFHLTKLRHLITVGEDGNYTLTDDGKEALWSIGNISVGTKGQEVDWKSRRIRTNRLRIILTSLVIMLVVLGSAVAFQHQDLASLQTQVSSQNEQIAAYAKVQPFTNGQSATLVLGQKNFTAYAPSTSISGEGLNSPFTVLMDSTGNLWVIDFGNNRVLEFEPPFSSGMAASIVIGQQSLYSNTPAVSISGLGNTGCGPTGGAFDRSGNLWVADLCNSRILEFKRPFSTGMSASVVIGQDNFTSSNSGVSASRLNCPTDLVFDSHGDFWTEDSCNNRVLEFAPPFSNGMRASVVIGQDDFTSNKASTTRSGLITECGDIAMDPSGNLWVGDEGNDRILEFKPPFSNGMNASLVIGQLSFNAPPLAPHVPCAGELGSTVAFDTSGNLWARSYDRLLEFKPPFATGMQPSLEIGQPDFTSSWWIGGRNGLAGPSHPAFDSSGNMWVPDSGNNRVLEFLAGASSGALGGGVASTHWELPFVGATAVVVAAAAVVADAVLRRRMHQT